MPTAITTKRRRAAAADTRLRVLWGRRIAEQRQLHQMSRKALAEKVGVTEQAVGAWERGESAPKPGMQAQIAKALIVSWSILFAPEAA